MFIRKEDQDIPACPLLSPHLFFHRTHTHPPHPSIMSLGPMFDD